MLAIMRTRGEWCQYLLGAKEEFEIWTDHENLKYFRKPQKLNRRQAQWVTEMQDYQFTLTHMPGSQIGKADSLLRQPGHKRGENDNKNVTMLKPKFF
jgi:hypothetical protein